MPAGGLSAEGKWIGSRSSEYLVPYQALSKLFRGKFLAGVKRLHCQGKLQIPGALAELADWQALEK